MKIVCISDTHNQHNSIIIPKCDMLICAGDFTIRGSITEIANFSDWFSKQNVKYKLLVSGNHDTTLDSPNRLIAETIIKERNIHYLCDSGITIDGINFWGSPWQPVFYHWGFNLPRGKALADKWALIPDDTNVLITHCPPAGILDRTMDWHGESSVGCEDLARRVFQLKELKLQVFGHIHNSHGQLKFNDVMYVNAAICGNKNEAVNQPIIVEI